MTACLFKEEINIPKKEAVRIFFKIMEESLQIIKKMQMNTWREAEDKSPYLTFFWTPLSVWLPETFSPPTIVAQRLPAGAVSARRPLELLPTAGAPGFTAVYLVHRPPAALFSFVFVS